MNPYTLSSIVLTLAIAIAYINHRYIKLQSTIAIMAGSLLISLVFILLQHMGITSIANQTKTLLIQTNFHHLLMNGLLSFLLFAGSLTIDFSEFKSRKMEISLLATISTIVSTLLVAICTYYLLPVLHVQLPFLYCLLFGALISPTDPIAVLATFKQIGAPKKLAVCVAGESLFNDGVGIVLFLTIYQLTFNNIPVTFQNVSLLFLEQALGGMAYGIILGWVALRLSHAVKDPKIIILLTIAIVTGGYSLALAIDISGPLAMVVAGMFLGNKMGANKTTTKRNDTLKVFWEIIDELLNAVLFLLIGFELLVIQINLDILWMTLATIPVVLMVRLLTVAIPMKALQLKRSHDPYTVTVLTWGGLRGGLAVALALSIPPSPYRDIIVAVTYGVVIFSVVVQGLTIKPIAKLAKAKSTA